MSGVDGKAVIVPTVIAFRRLLHIGVVVKWLPATFSPVSNSLPTRLFLFERSFFGHETAEACEPQWVKFTDTDCCLHCATGLLIMLAIPKPAVIHEIKDVNECPLNATA
jgi:hypothetical protein